MPHVTSRVNGLQIAIPADARGVIPRFASKGGNELVFKEPMNREAAKKALAKEKKFDLGKTDPAS